MTPAESNKALVRRFHQQIDQGNIDVLDELVAEDYLDHNPGALPQRILRESRRPEQAAVDSFPIV